MQSVKGLFEEIVARCYDAYQKHFETIKVWILTI